MSAAAPAGAVRAARRAGWNVVDQVLSSAGNVALSLAVASAVDARAFSAFAVAFTVYAVVVALLRAVVGTPLTIQVADAARSMPVPSAAPGAGNRTELGFRAAAGAALGFGALLGLASGVMLVAGGVLQGGEVGPPLVALGVALPGLLVQDAGRLAAFAARRPSVAVASDGAWTAAFLVGAVAVRAIGATSAVPYLLVWGATAAGAAVLGGRLLGAGPRLGGGARWLADHGHIARFLLGEAVLLQAARHGTVLLVGGLSGLVAVGALRAADLVLGPVTVLMASSLAFGVPEVARRRPDRSERLRLAAALSGALVAAALAWGAVLLLVPDSTGSALLGDTWSAARDVLPATVVGATAAVAAVGPACVLYARGQTRTSFRVHGLLAVLLVAFGAAGGALGDAPGAAAGLAAAFCAVLPLWWSHLLRTPEGWPGSP